MAYIDVGDLLLGEVQGEVGVAGIVEGLAQVEE